MNDRKISIVLGIKNRLQTGLKEAEAQAKSFTKSLRTSMSTALAPAAIAGAIGAAINKAVDFFDKLKAKALESENAIKQGNADAYFRRVTEELKKQATAYADLQKATKDQIELEKTTISLLQEREQIIRHIAQLQGMRGLGSAEREEAGAQASAEEKISKAINDQLEAQRKIEGIGRQIAENEKRREQIQQNIKQAQDDFAKASQREGQITEQLNKKNSGWFAKSSKAQVDALKDALKTAAATRDKAFEAINTQEGELKKLESDRRKLQQESVVAEEERKNKVIAIDQARAEESDRIDKKAVARREKSGEEAIKQAKKNAEAILKTEQELAREKARLLDRETQERRRQLQERISLLEQESRKHAETAQKRIAEILKERATKDKDSKADKSEAKRARRLEAEERRGVRLSRRDRAWMEAFKEREDARQRLEGAGVGLAQARQEIAAMDQQKSLEELQSIRGGIDKLAEQLNQLLRWR